MSEQWWVVPEGSPGLFIGGLIHDFTSGPLSGVGSQVHVVQSATKPAGAEGPYPTKAAAQAAADGINGKITKKTTPGPSLTGLAAIGDFFGRLTEGSTWVRVGQVALGLILLAVGVARITHAVPIATKIAKTAGAVAV